MSSVNWTPPAALEFAGLAGLDAFMQVVFFDPLAAGAMKTAQTDGLALTLGC